MVVAAFGRCGCVHVVWWDASAVALAVRALMTMSAISLCLSNAGNQINEEGGSAIGDGIKSCPQLTVLDLSGKLMGSREGRNGVQGEGA